MQPWDTIGGFAIFLLLLAYGVGLPTTAIIAAVEWTAQRRARQAAQSLVAPPATASRLASAAVPFPAPGPTGWVPVTAPALAPSPLGAAFLRLQQLERQVLELRRLDHAPSPETCYRLAAAATALHDRYGDGSTIGRYAAGLLAIVAALGPPDLVPAVPPFPPESAPIRPPDRLRIGLARLVAAGRPIPVDWALSWLGHLPDRWPPGFRQPSRLAPAFTRRYVEVFPHGGVIVAASRDRLVLRYAPAGARFGGQPIEIATGLPEVFSLPDPARRLRAVAAAAVADLAAAGVDPLTEVHPNRSQAISSARMDRNIMSQNRSHPPPVR